MNTECFLNALGQIDERYIAEAISPKKMSRNWYKWSEFAACFCLVCTLAVLIVYGFLPEQTPPELPSAITLPSETESEESLPTVSEERPTSSQSLPTEPSSYVPPTTTEPPSTSESVPPTTAQPTEPSNESTHLPPSSPLLPPLICIHGVLYEWQSNLQDASVDLSALTHLGNILSYCGDWEWPDEHLEANEPITGATVYADNGRIILSYGDEIRIYTPYTT